MSHYPEWRPSVAPPQIGSSQLRLYPMDRKNMHTLAQLAPHAFAGFERHLSSELDGLPPNRWTREILGSIQRKYAEQVRPFLALAAKEIRRGNAAEVFAVLPPIGRMGRVYLAGCGFIHAEAAVNRNEPELLDHGYIGLCLSCRMDQDWREIMCIIAQVDYCARQLRVDLRRLAERYAAAAPVPLAEMVEGYLAGSRRLEDYGYAAVHGPDGFTFRSAVWDAGPGKSETR